MHSNHDCIVWRRFIAYISSFEKIAPRQERNTILYSKGQRVGLYADLCDVCNGLLYRGPCVTLNCPRYIPSLPS